VDVVHLGEVVQDLCQLVVPAARGVLHLSHVKLADARDGPAYSVWWESEVSNAVLVHLNLDTTPELTKPGMSLHPTDQNDQRNWRSAGAACGSEQGNDVCSQKK
jgi:hypothetical protein